VDVSLWVNPIITEKAKSLLGSDTGITPPGAEGLDDALAVALAD
jgi:hypothetical protein